MAEVIHRYVGRGEQFVPAAPRENDDARAEKQKADLAYTREKERAARSKRLESELRIAKAKRELIPRELVLKQSAFLVLSLRARLLALPAQHARELLNVADEFEMTLRLDSIVRSTLETLADLPLRVTDERWLEKLDEHEATPAVKRKIAK